ncbi:MAG: MFS transporter [Chloroflexota bacterium]
MKRLPLWQRNLVAIWIGQMCSVMGFSFVIPFLPLYVQELGVTEPHAVEVWAGMLSFAAGLSMAATAPVWGSLADRYGRKPMVLRATFGGALIVGSMGLVGSVEQLLILRFMQGAVTGVIAAANTLVASLTPRERLGFALGSLQMAVFTANSVGPLMGGVIADHIGFRSSFMATSVMLALGGLVVLLFVEERFERPAKTQERTLFQGLGGVVREPALLAFIAVGFTIQASNMMVSPVFPLFVQRLLPEGRNAASTVGLILGTAGVVGAFSALIIGRVSDRLGHRKVLAVCALGAGLSYVPQAFSQDTNQVLLLRAALGFFAGGMMPSVNALIALRAPRGTQGAAFGLNSMAASLGNALGPLTGAGLATLVDIRAVFVAAGASLLVVGGGASLFRPEQPPAPRPTGGTNTRAAG